MAHKPNNESKQYVLKLKPNTDNMEKAGVVNKINCQKCEGMYTGNTKNYLKSGLGTPKIW